MGLDCPKIADDPLREVRGKKARRRLNLLKQEKDALSTVITGNHCMDVSLEARALWLFADSFVLAHSEHRPLESTVLLFHMLKRNFLTVSWLIPSIGCQRTSSSSKVVAFS